MDNDDCEFCAKEVARSLRDIANRLQDGRETLKHFEISFGYDAWLNSFGYEQNDPDGTTTITMKIQKAQH